MPAGHDEAANDFAPAAAFPQAMQERPFRLLVCGPSDGRAVVLALLGTPPQDGPTIAGGKPDGPIDTYRPVVLGGRRFLVADCADGCAFDAAGLAAAAVADAAILVVDPAAGMDQGVRLDASVLSLLAVPELVLAARHTDPAEPAAVLLARIADAFETATVGMALPKAAAILLPPATDCMPVDLSEGERVSELVSRLETLPTREPPATSAGGHLPGAADQFSAKILWLDAAPMVPSRDYVLGCGAMEAPMTVTALRYRLDPASGARESAAMLRAGELGVCNISLSQPLALQPFADAPALGCFVVRERLAGATAGATLGIGTIRFPLRRATNIQWQALDVTKAARSAAKGQKPVVLWLTGLSGSGKSTIANRLERRLHHLGRHTYLLDGDNVRHGLNRDLGFTEADRVENIRRVAEVARLFADAGLIVLVSFISPFRSERRMARELMPAGEFVEIFVDTPITECARRDPKGLYAKARRGEIKNFTGIDSPYEPPLDPDLRLVTLGATPEDLVAVVEEYLRGMGIIG